MSPSRASEAGNGAPSDPPPVMYSQTKMRTTDSFRVIPVLDLCRGVVVRAIAGRRTEYRPLRSPLCNSSRADDILHALLELHPFLVVYLADLDAIQAQGNNRKLIARLCAGFPGLEFWVDAGASRFDGWMQQCIRGIRPVIGSESQTDMSAVTELLSSAHGTGPILSLDFLGGRFLGPAELLHHPALWPDQVIIMTLDRVGVNQGPDMDRLTELRRLVPGKRFFAAGGVRDREDLIRLQRLGIQGTLVSTALHEGRLGRQELNE